MIEPPSFSSGKAFCTVNSVPLTLMLNSRSSDGPKGNEFANAGVGEHNIDALLRLSDDLVQAIKVSQLGNVSLHSSNVGADGLHGLVEFLLAAARDEDIGTLLDEPF